MQVSDSGGIFPSVKNISACVQYIMLALLAHWGRVLFAIFCVNACRGQCVSKVKSVSQNLI